MTKMAFHSPQLLLLFSLLLVLVPQSATCFTLIPLHPNRLATTSRHNNNGVKSALIITKAQMKNKEETEYKNLATSILSNFMQNKDDENKSSKLDNESDSDSDNMSSNPILSKINFNAPKFKKVPIEKLASIIDAELYEKEWFVNGNVNPIYFDETFEFQDPDVKLQGIEEYAKGVNKLFDSTSRAEIISTVVNDNGNDNDNDNDNQQTDTITVTWRLSGKVNIGPGDGLTIKPYICYTDFKVDKENGLITFQEDRFDIPQWDILVSALFPFLIGKVTSDPAPPVPRREIVPKVNNKGKNGFDLESMFSQLFK